MDKGIIDNLQQIASRKLCCQTALGVFVSVFCHFCVLLEPSNFLNLSKANEKNDEKL
jgi:hypothetical protein